MGTTAAKQTTCDTTSKKLETKMDTADAGAIMTRMTTEPKTMSKTMNQNQDSLQSLLLTDLGRALVAKNLRTVLQPLAKSLGGIPTETVKATGCAWGHLTNCTRPQLVMGMLATYTQQEVAEKLAVIEAGVPMATTQASGGGLEILRDAIAKIAAGTRSGVDADQVRDIVAEAIGACSEELIGKATEAARAAAVTTIRVENSTTGQVIECGVQHQRFPLLLKVCGARLPNGRRLNAWVYGPAGTGKTMAAAGIAKALGLAFRFTGAIETAYALLGYADAHGRTVRTPFRESWENGGVFLMDEADASHPQALAALNAAIDGGTCAFPDGMIARHPDCIILAGANTAGRGGNTKYAGRVRQDEAFLSRWTLVEWPHDDALEAAIVGGDEFGAKALKMVKAFRSAAAAEKIDGASTTIRASLDSAALLRAGVDAVDVAEMTIRKGMAPESWDRLREAARALARN